MRLLMIKFLIFFYLGVGSYYAKATDIRKIAEITPLEVTHVLNCGVWDSTTENGYYRFLHIDSPDLSGSFLQKVKVEIDDGVVTQTLEKVIDLEELNDDLFEFSLHAVKCEETSQKLVIDGLSQTNQKPYKIEIAFGGLSDYLLRMTTQNDQ